MLATNVEFWSAVVLDHAAVPPELFTPMFTCARVAGWSAHILEQKREGRLIRPTAKYVGAPPRPVSEVPRHVDELSAVAPVAPTLAIAPAIPRPDASALEKPSYHRRYR